jgi:hypothetical protein
MFTIWNPGRDVWDSLAGCYYKNFIPIDIEKKDWALVNNIQDAQFIHIIGDKLLTFGIPTSTFLNTINKIKKLNLRPDQKILIFDVFHIDDTWNDQDTYSYTRDILQKEIPNEFAIIHTNFANPLEIKYDFLWNRQKIYFTDYNYIDLSYRTYTCNADARNFQLTKIQKTSDSHCILKKFLCPNRTYPQFDHHPRIQYRKKLRELFLEKYSNEGYYSSPHNGMILPCENNDPRIDLVEGGWYPIANSLYNETFFSIYVETLSIGKPQIPNAGNTNYRSITEKTWDPLIKGHFILPFGYKGLIEHIRSYGFHLPDWIDYSYDEIDDDQERFDKFLSSAEKLMKFSIIELMNLYNRDRWMLVMNRDLFWTRPYDSLHDKVRDWFNMDENIAKQQGKSWIEG